MCYTNEESTSFDPDLAKPFNEPDKSFNVNIIPFFVCKKRDGEERESTRTARGGIRGVAERYVY